MAPLWKLLALALVGYGLLCLLVLLVQRNLMYFPSRMEEGAALAEARSLGFAAWRDVNGGVLGWRRPAASGAPRVLVFHGNAGSALDRQYYPPLFGDGIDTILLEYPGYGPRAGAPSEAVLVEAGAAALRQLRSERPDPIWLLGESLGSGVACAVAARQPGEVAGLLLVIPFARMTEVAAWHYPYLPVRLLLRDRWDNVAALQGFAGPVELVIAGRDEVVGAEQGRRLAASRPANLRVWLQPEAGHNTLDLRPQAPPWPELRTRVAGSR